MEDLMKKVLITGANRGIGKAIAQIFAKNNYLVIAPQRAELDLNSRQSVDDFIAKNADTTFDVIVNNAGINELNLIEDVSEEEIEMMINVNFVSHVKLIKAFIPKMKQQNYGRIVNIGSIWAVVSKPKRGLYSAMKNAMHGITNTIALEAGEHNVLVNTVCPGFTLTELTRKNNSKEEIDAISQTIPLRRMAEPMEIAEAVFFLCSDKNSYITGQKICVDGGYTVQ